MAAVIRIGIMGLCHDHVWSFIQHAQAHTEVSIVAAADADATLRSKAHAAGVATTFSDPYAMLAESTLDAVAIFGDNRSGPAYGIAAAMRGLHIFVEKPLAADYPGAVALYGAAKHAGVVLMVNWPVAWWPSVQHAISLIKRGKVGQLFQVNYRAAHAGPRENGCDPQFVEWLYDPYRNGAGVIMDYCCYGAALTCMFLGLPAKVSTMAGRLRKYDLPAEDNAVLVMQHATALSTATASWTQIGHMTSYEPTFYGDKGTLMASNGKLYFSDAENDRGTLLRVPTLAPTMKDPVAHFAAVIRGEVALIELCNAETALMAQQVLSAGIISVNTSAVVTLP
ncbi:MAG: Gfo/Idh/MocA family protein, partial [Roseiflexaceae bacterium]